MRHTYRPDIQIYRAVAVSLVLLFHFGVPGFSAGFLGVDIFFVISGYLMTSLHDGNSSALDFYIRRARRLIPAYIAVVALTLIVAFRFTVPSDFSQVREQVLYAATLSSNVGFALQNSYFSSFEFNPLLHLWSLAVECQFYLIFPWLILGLRRWRLSLFVLIMLSLGLCIAGVLISPKLSFFLLPMRIWEFGIGIWVARNPVEHFGRKWVGALALAVMILVPLLPINGEVRDVVFGHPALGAIVVCLATGFALAFGQPDRLVNSTPGRAAKHLGNVSYSLYLAHWPVLVLMHYVPFGGTRSEATSIYDGVASLVVIAVVTSALFYAFERNGPRLFTPLRAGFAAAGLAVAALVTAPIQVQRFQPADKLAFAAMKDRSYIRCGKVFRVLHPGEQLCQIGDGAKGTVLLIGDSFSDSLKETFAASASRAGLKSYFAVDNQPLITAGLDAAWLTREIRARNARAVYLHFTTEHFGGGVLDAAKAASAATGTPFVVILPPPVYEHNVPQWAYLNNHGKVNFERQSLPQYRIQNKKIANYSYQIGLNLLDIAPLFCTPVCAKSDIVGRLLYFDHAHLTLTGAKRIEPALAASLAHYVNS